MEEEYGLFEGYKHRRDISKYEAETKRREIQARAAEANLVYNKQNDSYEPAKGSVEDLLRKQNEMLIARMEKLQTKLNKADSWNGVKGAMRDGNFEAFNSKIVNHPDFKPGFQQMGVQSVEKLDFGNELHTKAYEQAGFGPEILDYFKRQKEAMLRGDTEVTLASGAKVPVNTVEEFEAQQKQLGLAYPIVRGTDGNFKAVALEDFIKSAGLIQESYSESDTKEVFDVIAGARQALSGTMSTIVQANVAKAEAEAGQAKLTMEQLQKMANEMEPEEFLNYIKGGGKTAPTAFQKNYEYIQKTEGQAAADAYMKKNTGGDKTPAGTTTKSTSTGKPTAVMRNAEFEDATIMSMLKEAKVDSLADVDYTKLTGKNKLNFDQQAQKDAKSIDKDDVQAFISVSAAADKLNGKDLAKTTGIVDASITTLMERMGMNIDSKVLVQSGNYNLVRNALIRASFGSQVTGNELERMKSQLGTEFRADKTVRIKMAETLDNVASKFSMYKTLAPAFYAKEMAPRVRNLKNMASYLKSESAPSESKVIRPNAKQSVPAVGSVVDGYKFKGGNPADPNSWIKVK